MCTCSYMYNSYVSADLKPLPKQTHTHTHTYKMLWKSHLQNVKTWGLQDEMNWNCDFKKPQDSDIKPKSI